ncbi:HAD family phosphatase [Dysgonomonas sp. 520]|uniref:HAD family hydrolase n=1 Tax=Dysgonomonas sp. 520 TaxID=2302931 RepID=UPI0013D663C5|nr:HAD family phosphatase [Dysgonomonas sp. 520]NDW10643.1 HAD family phosphatase [Dysgonomonas sp. 520]
MKLIDKFPGDIRNIIFDFGGVIMDINIGKTIVAFANLDIAGLKPDDIISSHKSFLYELEIGTITPDEFISSLYREYPTAKRVSDKLIWDAWNALLQPYDPERILMVDKLKNDYNLYLLSNTNFPHRIKFKEMFRRQFGENFEDLFIECFYSDEMHLRKPDPEIYKRVIEETWVDPSKTLFIDDNEANITYARKVGLHAYHLTGGEKITDLFE